MDLCGNTWGAPTVRSSGSVPVSATTHGPSFRPATRRGSWLRARSQGHSLDVCVLQAPSAQPWLGQQRGGTIPQRSSAELPDLVGTEWCSLTPTGDLERLPPTSSGARADRMSTAMDALSSTSCRTRTWRLQPLSSLSHHRRGHSRSGKEHEIDHVLLPSA